MTGGVAGQQRSARCDPGKHDRVVRVVSCGDTRGMTSGVFPQHHPACQAGGRGPEVAAGECALARTRVMMAPSSSGAAPRIT